MKRFTNDIIRILKNKPQRSMSISEIPIEYGKMKLYLNSIEIDLVYRNGV
jgi:hypothetical protein